MTKRVVPAGRTAGVGSWADDRDPKLLADAVERLVETKGWTTEINVHTLLGAGPALALPTLPTLIPRGTRTLSSTVWTDSTAWATQLRYMAPQLVAMLNENWAMER